MIGISNTIMFRKKQMIRQNVRKHGVQVHDTDSNMDF